ncbi:unnamed protein product, partial [marine sediment metagenome]
KVSNFAGRYDVVKMECEISAGIHKGFWDPYLNHYEVEFYAYHQIHFRVQPSTGGPNVVNTDFGSDGENYWRHWRFIFNDAVQKYTYYRDGVYMGTEDYEGSGGYGVIYFWLSRQSAGTTYLDDFSIVRYINNYRHRFRKSHLLCFAHLRVVEPENGTGGTYKILLHSVLENSPRSLSRHQR